MPGRPRYQRVKLNSYEPLLECHGHEGAVHLVLRPEGDGPRRCARPGDIGALAGPVQNLRACRVRDTHGTFDKEHAECLIVDGPAPEFCPANAYGRDRRRHAHIGARQLRHLAGEKSEGADHPEPDRSASRGGVKDVPIEHQLSVLAKRQSRVIFEGELQPRRRTSRHGLVEKTDALRPSARVAPPRAPLASPCMRLTVPIASCAATWWPAKLERSVTATMISRCNMSPRVRNTVNRF